MNIKQIDEMIDELCLANGVIADQPYQDKLVDLYIQAMCDECKYVYQKIFLRAMVRPRH